MGIICPPWRGGSSAAALLVAGLFTAGLPRAAHAATFVVNSTTDAVDNLIGDGVCATAAGDCTLRAAVQEANHDSIADTIDLPMGTYSLTLGGSGEDAAATGDLDILWEVTIEGDGGGNTIVDASLLTPRDRVFHVIGTAAT